MAITRTHTTPRRRDALEASLRELRGIPARAAELVRRQRQEIADFRRRHDPAVYQREWIDQQLQEIAARHQAQLQELQQQAQALLQEAKQEIQRRRQATARDPGLEQAKARAWQRYAAALERAHPLTLIDLAARDPDPLLALTALQEELPAALRLSGADERTVAEVTDLLRQRLLPHLPEEQRAVELAAQEVTRGEARLTTALAYAGQLLVGEWEDLPGLPDWEGAGLVPIDQAQQG